MSENYELALALYLEDLVLAADRAFAVGMIAASDVQQALDGLGLKLVPANDNDPAEPGR